MTVKPADGAGESAPLYRQVKDFIVEQVLSGAWPAGSRVPSENVLLGDFGVSRMTVHRALRELMTEGWLTRVQGAGTFVAEQKPQSALLEIRNIRSEITERGHQHRADMVLLANEVSSRAVATALEIRSGTRVFHSLLVHRENGVPVQLEDRYVLPAFAPDYLKQDFTQITPNEYLTHCGQIEAFEHVIEAEMPTPEVQRLLQLAAPEPCLLLTRRTWSQGRVVSLARLTHPGSRYRLAGRQDYSPGRSAR